MTDIKAIADGLSEARKTAIKDADRSGIIPFLSTLVVLYGLATVFGYDVAFWFGLGALISAVAHLAESGRNIEIKEKAELEYLRNHIMQEQNDG